MKYLIIILILGLGVLIFQISEAPIGSPKEEMKKITTIGQSIENRKIVAHSFGKGEKVLVFIGGIHGGYEANSSLLAYQIIEKLNQNPELIPGDLTLKIIPEANPDGLYLIIDSKVALLNEDFPWGPETLAGRVNAREVDLNRNFDCRWQPEGYWREQVVKAGESPFSEPESQALRDYLLDLEPAGVVFWHSAGGGIYLSFCEDEVLPQTQTLANLYAEASNYPVHQTFDHYEVTGAADDWLASLEIPAITVELKNHQDSDLAENWQAVLNLLSDF